MKKPTEVAMPTIKLISTKGELVKRIDAWASNVQNAQTEAHIIACSVMQHVCKHGNTAVLIQFIDAAPDMVRKNALQQWFETFSQLTFSAVDDKSKATWRFDRTKKNRLGDAMLKPFWKFKANEGAPYVPLNMDAYLKQQITKLEKDQKETGADHSVIINALKGYKPGVTVTQ